MFLPCVIRAWKRHLKSVQSDSQLNLHLNVVMEQINDDSDCYNSDDDLVDDQDGELDFDISGRDPLDRAGDEPEHDEGPHPHTLLSTNRKMLSQMMMKKRKMTWTTVVSNAHPVHPLSRF